MKRSSNKVVNKIVVTTETTYDKLEDMTEYFTSENLTETANNLSKVCLIFNSPG